MNFEIAVLGAAESGIGAAVLAQKKGIKTWVSDAGNIKQKYKDVLLHHAIAFEEGKHTPSIILKSKLIIKSPGIPETANIIKQCRSKNIPIISEIEFADRY
ncbi:MAG: UDP-N-acetylmuramoyl-L-alanine--D-glutamate ligase, partial [Bacteroidales bacterium]|nr:UDP-N-acetylmuramoyl-L-alanine--D-glutamate ligase [Bacteroidales bacterium]